MSQNYTESYKPSYNRADRNSIRYLTHSQSFDKNNRQSNSKTKADEEVFTGINNMQPKNVLEHSQKLIEISQKVAGKYEKRYSKAKSKFEKDDEARNQRFNQTQGSMQKGVTQANGLENEIVKLIEARISMDQEHTASER